MEGFEAESRSTVRIKYSGSGSVVWNSCFFGQGSLKKKQWWNKLKKEIYFFF